MSDLYTTGSSVRQSGGRWGGEVNRHGFRGLLNKCVFCAATHWNRRLIFSPSAASCAHVTFDTAEPHPQAPKHCFTAINTLVPCLLFILFLLSVA